MSEPSIVQTDRAPAAIGPYSQAVVTGEWVFCSGQIPVVPETGALVEGDITQQTERVLTNLSAVLEAAGASLDRVLKTTVFLADMKDFSAMNEVYARRFGAHRPARSTIQAAGLPRGCRVEIECVALRTTR
ncbi:MAG: RidA family protein [Gemmatimonadales bacterium]